MGLRDLVNRIRQIQHVLVVNQVNQQEEAVEHNVQELNQHIQREEPH